MSLPRRFSLPLWPTVLVSALLLLTLNLGGWQLRREAEKLQLQGLTAQAQRQPPVSLATALASELPTAYRVVVQGHWRPAPLFLLANQSWQLQRGVHVLQWLQLSDGRLLLVDRGWLASSADALPAEGEVSLLGQLYQPGQPWRAPVLDLTLSPVDLPVLDIAVLRQNDANRLPLLLRLADTSPGVLQPNWQASGGMTPAKHRGYAVTWFSLSAVLVLMYIWWLFHLARKPNTRLSQHD